MIIFLLVIYEFKKNSSLILLKFIKIRLNSEIHNVVRLKD